MLKAACIATAMVLLPISPAHACSCAGDYDPRDALAASDAAIVGTYLGRHPADPTDVYGDTIYTFQVDEAVKGSFGETVEVHSGSTGASCGFELPEGASTGLFLHLEEGVYSAGLCDQIQAQRLREAAAPLPAPDGELPVRYVVGGSFGDQRVMSLDAQGRTIAYGAGDGDVRLLSSCPGSIRMAEVVYGYLQPATLVVRDLDTLEVVSETLLPFGRDDKRPSQAPVALYCRSGDGGDIAVLSAYNGYGYEPSKGMLWRIRGSSPELIRKGDEVLGSFEGDTAYLGDGAFGRDVMAVDLDSGRARKVGEAPGAQLMALSINSAGTRLAGVSFPKTEGKKPAHIWTMRVSTGKVKSAERSPYSYPADLVWAADDDRIVWVSLYGRSETFTSRLTFVTRFRYLALDTVVEGDDLYGVYYGSLIRSTVPGSTAEALRDLPTPTTYALLTVP
jgi:hypothetical protein